MPLWRRVHAVRIMQIYRYIRKYMYMKRTQVIEYQKKKKKNVFL